MTERIPLYDEENDYINEDHISEFAKALVWQDDEYDYDTGPTTPTNESATLLHHHNSNTSNTLLNDSQHQDLHPNDDESISPTKRPDLITSKSDWFPVRSASTNKKGSSEKRGKKKPRRRSSTISALQNEFRNSSTYFLLRWPILIFVGFWIGFLGFIYFLIRVYVALSEYFLLWTGERKKLRDNLRNSKDYNEWIENAIKLDKYLHLDQWSENPKFSYYDYKTIKLTISRLKSLRIENNILDMMVVLQGCLKRNFAGIENRQLYSHRYYGTKNLVEDYYREVVLCIDKVTEDTTVDIDIKRKFFKIVSKNFGKSALCLSGGATFAYTHFGIAKALLDQDLLPNIISGTSGGGLIAALLCTRTNEELKKLLVPQLARKITACEDPWYVWIPRFLTTGARFDSVSWARKSNFFTYGSSTFEEASKRTGRKLNISTVPADPHSPVILCNDITSPHCIIWSTLLASSAVPGILNPVVLMMKNPSNGQVIPFSLGSKWRDGSLRTDIPIEALNTYYNVNFTIVSQVNPHISLFFFAPKGTVGRPVSISRSKTSRKNYASFRGGFIATALEQLLRLEIKKWLQIVKSLDLLPHFLQSDWSNIWLQNFTGSITIWPRNRLIDFWYILSDPTEKRMQEIITKGERCMYPRLLFIKHRASIEKAIEKGKKLTFLSYKQTHKSASVGDMSDSECDEHDDDEYVMSDYDVRSFKEKAGLLNNERYLLEAFGGEGDAYDFEEGEEDDEEEEEFDDEDSDAFSPGYTGHRRNTIF
ncbi:hypothetical protein SBY92_001850 [Candida maltosa Xu316]